jgi:predicted aspartyl protease
MQSIADRLPPDVARQIHPDWRKNEADYWTVRDSLVSQYADQWVAFADGVVIASGTSPVEVFHKAQQSGKHPYVTCVGREHEPCRMRRASFQYDQSYPNEALPLITVEFRKQSNQSGIALDRVIPDTGADATALPWSDCRQLQLDPSEGVPGLIGGVGQSSAATLVFSAWVHLDNNDYQCRLQADFSGNERILGRDVLNRMNVLFRGPSGEIVVNP